MTLKESATENAQTPISFNASSVADSLSLFGLTIPNDVVLHLLSFFDFKDLFAIMLTCKMWYQFINNEENIWKGILAKYISLDQVQKPENISWKEFCKWVTGSKYVRFVMALDPEKADDISYLLLDVNLGTHRKVEAAAFPDWQQEEEEVKEFLRRNPGYVD